MLPPPPAARASVPARIQDVIPQVLQTLDHSSRRTVDVEMWQAVAGPALAAHSTPVDFHDGRLTVHVNRPGHLFLLHLKQRELLQALQQHLGPGVVQALRFRAGART